MNKKQKKHLFISILIIMATVWYINEENKRDAEEKAINLKISKCFDPIKKEIFKKYGAAISSVDLSQEIWGVTEMREFSILIKSSVFKDRLQSREILEFSILKAVESCEGIKSKPSPEGMDNANLYKAILVANDPIILGKWKAEIFAKAKRFIHETSFKMNEIKSSTPEKFRLDWKKLGLYEKKGANCITKNNSENCYKKGKELEERGNLKLAIEHYRSGCVHTGESFVRYDDTRSVLRGLSCPSFIELSFESYSKDIKEYVTDAVWRRCKFGKGQCPVSILPKEYKIYVYEKQCDFLNDLIMCRLAAFDWLPFSKEKSKKYLKAFCSQATKRRCDFAKKIIKEDAEKLGIEISIDDI